MGYIALIVAVVGGGGSFAVAASTTHKTTRKRTPTAITACVSNRTGEIFLHHSGRCEKGRHKVSWSVKGSKGARGSRGATGATGAAGATGATGPAGASATAFGLIGPVTTVSSAGLTAQKENSPGVWQVTLTNPACAHTANVLVVSPTDGSDFNAPPPPINSAPVAWAGGTGTSFTVDTGYEANGSFTAADYAFNVIAECGATAVPGQ